MTLGINGRFFVVVIEGSFVSKSPTWSPTRWLGRSRIYYTRQRHRARQLLDRVVCCCSKRQGTYLTHFYLVTKLLYVANAVSQFFIMNAFLSHDFGLYGFDVSVLCLRKYGGFWVLFQ